MWFTEYAETSGFDKPRIYSRKGGVLNMRGAEVLISLERISPKCGLLNMQRPQDERADASPLPTYVRTCSP